MERRITEIAVIIGIGILALIFPYPFVGLLVGIAIATSREKNE